MPFEREDPEVLGHGARIDGWQSRPAEQSAHCFSDPQAGHAVGRMSVAPGEYAAKEPGPEKVHDPGRSKG